MYYILNYALKTVYYILCDIVNTICGILSILHTIYAYIENATWPFEIQGTGAVVQRGPAQAVGLQYTTASSGALLGLGLLSDTGFGV